MRRVFLAVLLWLGVALSMGAAESGAEQGVLQPPMKRLRGRRHERNVALPTGTSFLGDVSIPSVLDNAIKDDDGGKVVETWTPESSENDARLYRAIRLHNGIEAVLVSDPEAPQAAVAVDVGAGSFDNPPDRQGLAHFLEHCLFLGTRSFPEESSYGEFLSSQGGSFNAFTADEHTNYFLDISPAQLEPALHRLSRFFVEPLMTKSSLSREINAVNAEHVKNLRDDGWRLQRLLGHLARKTSPIRQFSTGSLQTLGPEAIPTDVLHASLLDFYQQHYVAANIRVAVLGREDLDVLQTWASQYFGDVPTGFHGVTAPSGRAARARSVDPAAQGEGLDALLEQVSFVGKDELMHGDTSRAPSPADVYQPPFDDSMFGSVVLMQPMRSGQTLTWVLPMPPQRGDHVRGNLAFLLSMWLYDGPGSACSLLRAEGLVDSVSWDHEYQTSTFDVVMVDVELTRAGLQQVETVTHLMWEYLSRVRHTVLTAAALKLDHRKKSSAAAAPDDDQVQKDADKRVLGLDDKPQKDKAPPKEDRVDDLLWRYEQAAAVSNLFYRFVGKQDAMDYVSDLAHELRVVGPRVAVKQTLLGGGSLYESYEPEMMGALLVNWLRPGNSFYVLAANTAPTGWTKWYARLPGSLDPAEVSVAVEPIYGTRYAILPGAAAYTEMMRLVVREGTKGVSRHLQDEVQTSLHPQKEDAAFLEKRKGLAASVAAIASTVAARVVPLMRMPGANPFLVRSGVEVMPPYAWAKPDAAADGFLEVDGAEELEEGAVHPALLSSADSGDLDATDSDESMPDWSRAGRGKHGSRFGGDPLMQLHGGFIMLEEDEETAKQTAKQAATPANKPGKQPDMLHPVILEERSLVSMSRGMRSALDRLVAGKLQAGGKGGDQQSGMDREHQMNGLRGAMDILGKYDDIPSDFGARVAALDSLASSLTVEVPPAGHAQPSLLQWDVRSPSEAFQRIADDLTVPSDGKRSGQWSDLPDFANGDYRLWYQQASQPFNSPKLVFHASLWSPMSTNNARSEVLQHLYSHSLERALQDVLAVANDAGLQASVECDSRGIHIDVVGFTGAVKAVENDSKSPEGKDESPLHKAEAVAALVTEVARALLFAPKSVEDSNSLTSQFDYSLTPAMFAQVKQDLGEEYRNYLAHTPLDHAKHVASLFLHQPASTVFELSKALRTISASDMAAYVKSVLSDVSMEVMVFGNAHPATARALGRLFFANVPSRTGTRYFHPAAPRRYSQHREGRLSRNYLLQTPTIAPQERNSVAMHIYQYGWTGAEEKVYGDVLSLCLHEAIYDQLRTKEQLGYIVASGGSGAEDPVFSFSVAVQSAVRPADYVSERISAVVKNQVPALVAGLSNAEFVGYLVSVLEEKLEVAQTMVEAYQDAWQEVANQQYQFLRKEQEALYVILSHPILLEAVRQSEPYIRAIGYKRNIGDILNRMKDRTEPELRERLDKISLPQLPKWLYRLVHQIDASPAVSHTSRVSLHRFQRFAQGVFLSGGGAGGKAGQLRVEVHAAVKPQSAKHSGDKGGEGTADDHGASGEQSGAGAKTLADADAKGAAPSFAEVASVPDVGLGKGGVTLSPRSHPLRHSEAGKHLRTRALSDGSEQAGGDPSAWTQKRINAWLHSMGIDVVDSVAEVDWFDRPVMLTTAELVSLSASAHKAGGVGEDHTAQSVHRAAVTLDTLRSLNEHLYYYPLRGASVVDHALYRVE